MKSHVTVSLTRKLLESLNPCGDGFDGIEHLLPATLSTDPEKNIDLAHEIARTERAYEGNYDVRWLYYTLVDSWEDLNYEAYDPWINAQLLAAVADVIATKKGR